MGLWTGAWCHKFFRYTVEQLFCSVPLFKCQFYQAIIMAIQVSSFVSWKKDCNLSNFATEAFLVSCYLGHRFLARGAKLAKSTPRWWQKSNDPGPFSALIIRKFQIVHRTLNRRLFSKCILTCGMCDGEKKKKLAKITFQWSSVRCLCPIASCSVSVG